MKVQQFVVIGLGWFGFNLAQQLIKLGQQVLSIDKDQELVRKMSVLLPKVIVADATDEAKLYTLNIQQFDCAIIASGDHIQTNIMIGIHLQKLGVKRIIAKAGSPLHGRLLQRLGIQQIVHPERDSGSRIAQQLRVSHLLDYILLSPTCMIAECNVPHGMQGMSLQALHLQELFGCRIVALRQPQGIILVPDPECIITKYDRLIILGTMEQIKFLKQM